MTFISTAIPVTVYANGSSANYELSRCIIVFRGTDRFNGFCW